jgi:hypothetical protein
VTTARQQALSRIEAEVARFEVSKPRVKIGSLSRMYFIPPEQEELARQLGHAFWFPTQRAYSVFAFAYAALFAIPSFTEEGVRRQPDRFTRKQLAQTIRSTSGFILDGFGYDRRADHPRDVFYSPSIVVRMVHGPHTGKARISNAAMAYFGYQLIRAAESFAPGSGGDGFEDLCRAHYDFFGSFFRMAGYPFARERASMEQFCEGVDRRLAGARFAHYWRNVLVAADELGVDITPEAIEAFLPQRSARHFSLARRARGSAGRLEEWGKDRQSSGDHG